MTHLKNDFSLTLSDTELAIVKLVKKGHTSVEIAHIRNCSSRTVEKHRSNIIKKLKLSSSQTALLVYVINNPDI